MVSDCEIVHGYFLTFGEVCDVFDQKIVEYEWDVIDDINELYEGRDLGLWRIELSDKQGYIFGYRSSLVLSKSIDISNLKEYQECIDHIIYKCKCERSQIHQYLIVYGG